MNQVDLFKIYNMVFNEMEWGNRCAARKLRMSFPKFCECNGGLTRTFEAFGRLKRRATPVCGQARFRKKLETAAVFHMDQRIRFQRCLDRLGQSMNAFRNIHVSKDNTRKTGEGCF